MVDADSDAPPIAVQRLAFPVTIVASLLVPLIVAVLWMASQFHGIDKRLTRIEDSITANSRGDDLWIWVDLFRAANPTLSVPEVPGMRRRRG